MALTLATIFWILVGVYAGVGFLFAIYFAFFGVGKVDPVAKGGTWGFRVAIFPGVMAFWPLFLWRLSKGTGTPPVEKNAHRMAFQDEERRSP